MPVGAASWSFTEDDFAAITQSLQRGDDLYQALVTSVPDLLVALFDRELRCQLIEGGMEHVAEWRQALLGGRIADAAAAEVAAQLERLLRPVLDGATNTFRWPLDDGRVLDVHAVPVRDPRAGVIGVMTVARDVTPRHEVDAAPRSTRTSAPARAR